MRFSAAAIAALCVLLAPGAQVARAAEAGKPARFGPSRFPEVDFGETLHVPTPDQGGDGRAVDDYKHKLRKGMRGATGTMTTREEALGQHGKLTTT